MAAGNILPGRCFRECGLSPRRRTLATGRKGLVPAVQWRMKPDTVPETISMQCGEFDEKTTYFDRWPGGRRAVGLRRIDLGRRCACRRRFHARYRWDLRTGKARDVRRQGGPPSGDRGSLHDEKWPGQF